MDEAHNSRTPLSFDTLARFRPSGILELTATPDTTNTPSNVLHSVSAAELKAEDMIKLPIQLETIPDWQKCLATAIDCREQLHEAAWREHNAGAKYLRPLVLIQAQARRAGVETLDVAAVKVGRDRGEFELKNPPVAAIERIRICRRADRHAAIGLRQGRTAQCTPWRQSSLVSLKQ